MALVRPGDPAEYLKVCHVFHLEIEMICVTLALSRMKRCVDTVARSTSLLKGQLFNFQCTTLSCCGSVSTTVRVGLF